MITYIYYYLAAMIINQNNKKQLAASHSQIDNSKHDIKDSSFQLLQPETYN